MQDWIRDIQDSGKIIILSTGTKYQVSSFDAFHSRFWMKLDKISVTGSKMTNHSQREQAVAVTQIR